MLTCLKLWKIVKIFNRRQIILQSTKFFVTPQSLFLGYIKVFYKGLISSTDAVFSLVFRCMIPGEWHLPWQFFRSKNQCGSGADYHAGLRQGKTWNYTSSAEIPTGMQFLESECLVSLFCYSRFKYL